MFISKYELMALAVMITLRHQPGYTPCKAKDMVFGGISGCFEAHSKDAATKDMNTRLCNPAYWKAEVQGFPMGYDMPMLLNIGMSHIVGKLLIWLRS